MASQHATSQLEELLNGLASTPSLYHSDTHGHAYLWHEDQAGSVQASSGLRGSGEINTLSLKAKSCTPTVYRYMYMYVVNVHQ